MTILVYVDEGAGPRSVRLLFNTLKSLNLHEKFSLQKANREILSGDKWQTKARLLIFPGGRDVPYHQSLKGKPNENIRRFVEDGGTYLGICAGGYYGCSTVEFEKGHPLEVIEQRELKFFPGIARGSAFGPNLFKYEDESGSRAARIQFAEEEKLSTFSVYFNGGCQFVDACSHPNTSILAKYTELPDQPAAVIECSVGKGKAILSGVHPEYSFPYIDRVPAIPKKVLQALREHETDRDLFFRSLIGRALTI